MINIVKKELEFDDEQELIKTIKGISSVVEDTKNLYLDLFEESRIKYNEKQNRNDRKIDNFLIISQTIIKEILLVR